MGQLVLTPTFADILTTLRSFLVGILPTNVDVVRGQVNRVPEPHNADFVVMTPIRQDRIETNFDGSSSDVLFTASIAGTTMTVASISAGTIVPPAQMFGTGLASGSGTVVSQLTGPVGGTGTYLITPAQNMSSSPVSAGKTPITQAGKFLIQLDVHGPNSSDNAMNITTLFRDAFAVETFAALNPNIAPLYADDPKQIPFINAENQYEDRWVVEAYLQANQTVQLPQQYMDNVLVDLIDVDATFPP